MTQSVVKQRYQSAEQVIQALSAMIAVISLVATLKGHSAFITSVAFSADGKTLASGSGDQTIKVWDVPTRQEVGTLEGHSDVVDSVAFSPNGHILASGSWDKTIKIWRITR